MDLHYSITAAEPKHNAELRAMAELFSPDRRLQLEKYVSKRDSDLCDITENYNRMERELDNPVDTVFEKLQGKI